MIILGDRYLFSQVEIERLSKHFDGIVLIINKDISVSYIIIKIV